METKTLAGGFTDAPIDAAHAFRAIMSAMARPGEIFSVSGATPPAPLSVAAGVVVLTLCDPETPVFLGARHDNHDLRDWITFHTGAPFAPPDKAVFAIGLWDDLPLPAFRIGQPDYPDRSATLIVEVPELDNTGAVLRGPGIKDHAQLSLPEKQTFQDNARSFPLGLDFIFTTGSRLAAMPRTTRVS